MAAARKIYINKSPKQIVERYKDIWRVYVKIDNI